MCLGMLLDFLLKEDEVVVEKGPVEEFMSSSENGRVIRQILSHLSFKDLKACRLASKMLLTQSTILLRDKVLLDLSLSRDFPKIEGRKVLRWRTEAKHFAKSAKWSGLLPRHLKLLNTEGLAPNVFTSQSRHLTKLLGLNLQSLTISLHYWNPESDLLFFYDILLRVPALQELNLDFKYGDFLRQSVIPKLWERLPIHINLKELEIIVEVIPTDDIRKDPHDWWPGFPELFMRPFPNLTSLSVDCKMKLDEDYYAEVRMDSFSASLLNGFVLDQPSEPPLPALKDLSVQFANIKVLERLMVLHPLRKLELCISTPVWMKEELSSVLQRHSKSLKELHLSIYLRGNGGTAPFPLPLMHHNFPKLRRFKISALDNPDDCHQNGVLDHLQECELTDFLTQDVTEIPLKFPMLTEFHLGLRGIDMYKALLSGGRGTMFRRIIPPVTQVKAFGVYKELLADPYESDWISARILPIFPNAEIVPFQ